jgi:hypothetical protein
MTEKPLLVTSKRSGFLKTLWYAVYLSVYYDIVVEKKDSTKSIKIVRKNPTSWGEDKTAYFNYKILAFEMNFGYGFNPRTQAWNLNEEEKEDPDYMSNLNKMDADILLSKMILASELYKQENKDERLRFHEPPQVPYNDNFLQHRLIRFLDMRIPLLLTYLGYIPGQEGTKIKKMTDSSKYEDDEDVFLTLRSATLERIIRREVLTKEVLDLALFLFSPLAFHENYRIAGVEFEGYPFEKFIEKISWYEYFAKNITYGTKTLRTAFTKVYNKVVPSKATAVVFPPQKSVMKKWREASKTTNFFMYKAITVVDLEDYYNEDAEKEEDDKLVNIDLEVTKNEFCKAPPDTSDDAPLLIDELKATENKDAQPKEKSDTKKPVVPPPPVVEPDSVPVPDPTLIPAPKTSDSDL